MNTIKKIGLVSAVAFALFAFNACGDDSSTSGSSDGGNRGGIPDTVETFMELSDYDCGKSQKCVATYLTEYHDMAVCDGDNGWVIGTLIEKMDCDFSSSSAKSSDSKSNDPAGVTDDSSDSKDNPSSAGTSTKSSNSSSSSVTPSDVEGSSKTAWDYLNPDINYGEFTDERDGQVYKTVKIGGQVWMAENLNYAYTGVPYNFSYNNDVYTSDSISWCYDNDPANCAKYGRLYTWAAAMDSVGSNRCGYGKTCRVASASSAILVRGICPKGWHLPSNDEWKALIVAVDGSITEYTSSNTAGSKLKSATGWFSSGNGTDSLGFSALPAANRYNRGIYGREGYSAYFWSSTENYSNPAYEVTLFYDNDGASLGSVNKAEGLSVRCIKDN
ncbi:MAG: fibrobacter succinogenes major paralogous domain-containing protein [Fibrobacter sp.]|nr:fibrobacter succinogenes major paralogous domain-containing protein [Fibrobacter sp.]